jgi:SAM-dependent methyltransferase
VKPELSVIIPFDAASRDAAAAFERELQVRPGLQVIATEDLKGAIGRVEADITVVQEPDRGYTLDSLTGLLAPIHQGRADVVIGCREKRGVGEAALGRFAAWVSEARLSDPLSGQRAFRTDVLRDVALNSSGPAVSAELLVKLAAQRYRFVEVPIPGGPRQGPQVLLEQAGKLLAYATTTNDADNAHEGYNTLARMEAGAPNYNAWLGRKFEAHAGRRVLEIGAGIGTITELLAPGREKVVALEVDDFYVTRLKNRFRDRANVVPLKSDLALADFRALRAERFDTIVLSNVLEHIEDDAGAVRRFAQIVQPGGRLLVLVPALPALFGAMDEAVGHFRRYTMPSLRAVLTSNGFSIERLEWMNLVGIPGWLVNSRLLRRRSMPPLQLRLYDQVAPLLAAAESKVRLPIGMSLFCVASVAG